jgi:hypothetical protein
METCCPRPDQPAIELTKKNEKLRLALRIIYIGEVAAVVASSNLFGFLRGILHLFSCWIDYMGYATVHYC